MKKTVAAGVLLLLLLSVALWSSQRIDTMAKDLSDQVESARLLWTAERFDEAAAALERTIQRWDAAESYTHVFLRHSEVDAASDAFFELLEAVESEEAGGANAAADKLLYHLDSIRSMEQISFKSVF